MCRVQWHNDGMVTIQKISDRASHVGQVVAALGHRPLDIKYLPRLARSIGTSPLALRTPWLPFLLIDRLDNMLDSRSKVFEYGGGGSTLFFADRAGEVVTVEHDVGWFPRLQESIAALGNVELLQRGPEDSFASYVGEIDRFPDAYFDLVVVDGRERVQCFEHSIAKVAPGGLLVIDDVDRAHYKGVFSMVDWPVATCVGLAPFKPCLAYTSVFSRPLNS